MRAPTVQQAVTRTVGKNLIGWFLGIGVACLAGGDRVVDLGGLHHCSSSLFSFDPVASASAATIPLDSITLGAVIQINGQNFVKIGDNRYLSVCAIESNKCLVKGQEWDETAGKCVCMTASANRQTWTGCSSLATWTEGTSEADNTNTVCLLDSQGSQLYQAHKYSDNKCYLTTSNSDTLEPLVKECPAAITNGYNASTGQCNCKSGYTLSPSGICYNASSAHVGSGICNNPTAYMQDWPTLECDKLPAWSATDTSGHTVCLADKRDGKTYMVRKLPDGRCWMVNNLAYGASDKFGTDVCVDRTIMTEANSGENIKDKFGGQSNSTTTYGLWGDCRGNAVWKDNDNNDISLEYKDGYYYNWAAAMGQDNTWYGADNVPTYQTDVQGLCPDGWVLPTGGTDANADFYQLARVVNGADLTNGSYYYADTLTINFFKDSHFAWNGVDSGCYMGSPFEMNGQGLYAAYWSSTFQAVYNAYALRQYTGYGVNPYNGVYKKDAVSIRCLKK